MEEAPIPIAAQELIDAYLAALESLRAHFYGIYIYGSIAFNAFEDLVSDVDIIALTQGEWSRADLRRLAALHKKLIAKHRIGKRLEVLYVPLRDLGRINREIAPYPTVHDGKFSPAQHGDLNGVTWWTLKHKSICLLGPKRDALPFEYDWRQVLLTMRYNLDVYFADKARTPYIYLDSSAVEFAVSNLCRILTTIENGKILPKSAAMLDWRHRLSERWQLLIDEAWRIRHKAPKPTLYPNSVKRMNETLAFIEYVRERGGRALDTAL